ncbi:bacteriohemerythrin [Pseudomonadota bacterium]
MKFVWDDKYSVQVELIDEQHKKYFSIVNRIADHLDLAQADQQLLIEIVKEMVDYALYHFETEEKYFLEFSCENCDGHIAEHNKYRSKMKEFLSKTEVIMDEDVAQLFEEISVFAIEWFTSHILVEDKKYTQCFNEHGLQ